MKQHWDIPTPMHNYVRSVYLTEAGSLLKTATRAPVKEVTLVDLLSKPFVGEPQVVTAMFRYLCQHLALPIDATPEIRTHYFFYKYFEPLLVPNRSYEWQMRDPHSVQTYLCKLDPVLWVQNFMRSDGSLYRNSSTLLGQLLVWGPPQPGMPLETRRELRALLCAVAPGSGLQPSQAFPLIDHAALPSVRHDFNEKATSGDYIYMGNGYVCRGGWSEPDHQGGAHYVSPEQLLCNPHLFSPAEVPAPILQDLQAKIRACVLPD